MNDTVQEQRQETLHARAWRAYEDQERRRLLADYAFFTDAELHSLACSRTPSALEACKALELRRNDRGEL